MFQDLALWPHLTVGGAVVRLDSVAVPKRGWHERVDRVLRLVRIGAFADRYPHPVVRRRAAAGSCARIAAEPRLVLLDEPLSSLDLDLRRAARQSFAACNGPSAWQRCMSRTIRTMRMIWQIAWSRSVHLFFGDRLSDHGRDPRSLTRQRGAAWRRLMVTDDEKHRSRGFVYPDSRRSCVFYRRRYGQLIGNAQVEPHGVREFVGSASWTVPSGVTRITIEIWGGGRRRWRLPHRSDSCTGWPMMGGGGGSGA